MLTVAVTTFCTLTFVHCATLVKLVVVYGLNGYSWKVAMIMADLVINCARHIFLTNFCIGLAFITSTNSHGVV